MAFFTDAVFDSGLLYVVSSVDQVHICSQQPTTYTEATNTYSLGFASTTLTAPTAGAPSGRSVTVPSITSTLVTASGTPTYWAVTDSTNTTLVATGPVSNPEPVTIDSYFTLGAITITIVDPIAV
jgi:hypothetical protein